MKSKTPTLQGEPSAATDPSSSWFERPQNIRGLIIGLCAACALLLLAEFFYENPHPHFVPLETSFGFQAWFGFAAFIAVVFLGRLLRLIVRRPEDYYDR